MLCAKFPSFEKGMEGNGLNLLITGANGMLGSALREECERQQLEYTAMTRKDADLTEPEQVKRFLHEKKPDIVFHCAAYTSVDLAETEQKLCHAVNVEATRAIAESCKEMNAALCYISTDYVFDGAGTAPHKESEQPRPLSVYGQSKYEGELIAKSLARHYIVRASWTYGDVGASFLDTMLRLGAEKRQITVVNDQIGAPVYAKELAGLLLALVRTGRYGTYHATGQGECSFAEYAAYIMETAELPAEIVPVSSEQYEQIMLHGLQSSKEKNTKAKKMAKRPKNSRLSMEELKAAGLWLLPDWKDSVKRAIEHRNGRNGNTDGL